MTSCGAVPESTEWAGGVKPVLKREPFPETPEEKLIRAEEIKEEGNQFFRDKNYNKARLTYAKAIAFIPLAKQGIAPYVMGMTGQSVDTGGGVGTDENEDELTLQGKKLLGLLKGNLAMTKIKLGKYRDALQDAEAAVVADPDNRKAMFRKGQALMYTGDFEKARKIFKDAAHADPQNVELRKALSMVDSREKAAKEKERKRFQRVLAKEGGLF